MNTRTLLAGTALAALSGPLAAQTVITTARTTPVVTSTVNNGQPADVRIETAGSVTVTSGTAVTVDSNNSVTNAGTIAISNADNATGILVTGPRTANITNSGTITIDETYTATDADNDGDIDGLFAIGTGRTAIRIDGPLTGNLSHTGTILVEGNNSTGIRATGPITGTFTHEGKTTVIGNNSVGVAMSDISGNVRLAGEITARGLNAQGAVLGGDLGGALRVQSNIAVSGYRTVPAPADVSRLDADDLLQGGSALVIEGNVAKGIIFEIAPADAVAGDNDEDKDGIEDAKEGNTRIIAYGAAPAVQIGGADDIAIGATEGTSNNFGIVMAGTILGDGVYSGVTGTGMRIGGRGGDVVIANGIQINGQIGGAARAANATALELGAGTTVPVINNAGTIAASVTGTDTTTGQATAILIDENASLGILRNSRSITAATTKAGSAVAILDRSGTLGLIENSGAISASGADAASNRNVAIDLSARTAGSIVRQTAVSSGNPAPSIIGDIRFGSGNDLLELLDGGVSGTVSFGGGTNQLLMSGDAIFSGTADFGGGAGTLRIADTAGLGGRLANAQNVAVNLAGGTLALTGPATIASLDVGATGVIGATLGGAAGTDTAITVTGTANFATGSKIRIRLADLDTAGGTYTVISAGSLTGGSNLTADSALVPFLYKAALAVSGNNINVAITRKATADLGLNASESAAFDSLFDALGEDDKVAGLFLGINNAEVFQAYVAQTLPDHAGGTFEGLSQGLRAFDRHFMDPNTPFDEEGKFRIIADFANWNLDKERGDSAAFDLTGLGFRGGAEYLTGFGAVGVTGSWLWSKHKNGPFDNSVLGDSYEAGVHWRGKFGPVIGFARVGAGKSSFSGSRVFAGGTGTDAVNYTIQRDWDGDFVTATGGVSIEGGSQFFFFRPSVVIDYLRLKEDGYTETGGGDALNLTVEDRASKEVGINGAVAVGADLWGMQARDTGWFRLEAEGGWRELLTSDLGATRARYGEGDLFTLNPEGRDSGWFARARALGGDGSYKIAGELGLEEQFGEIGYSLRASIRFGW
ncbi:autotransporter domain-containing protein [Porphyrobacter sp. YT40]|uniref:autotransporter domain-containing protein n=1 Tax=Porphyrobacter sp. YT40 TaxID=2547601 RepID=UPI00114269C4|nr:autotransporter domain-containing protein [Porphyrobacter sp. YT40]QDH35737.1 autotransporter domain-containing protein [Porphyrobacter sp. YT40]